MRFGYARLGSRWTLSAIPGESGLVYHGPDSAQPDDEGFWAIVCN